MKEGKQHLQNQLSPAEFHWLCESPWSRYRLRAPTSPSRCSRPSLPSSHSGNYDSYYRGKGEQQGEETGRRGKEGLIENERPAHPGTAAPSRAASGNRHQRKPRFPETLQSLSAINSLFNLCPSESRCYGNDCKYWIFYQMKKKPDWEANRRGSNHPRHT